MFELPDSLQGLALEELNALLVSATSEFNTLGASDDVSDEALERLSVLADGIEALRAEIAANDGAPAAPAADAPEPAAVLSAAERLAALRARVEPPAAPAPVADPAPATPAAPPAVVATGGALQPPRPAPSIILPEAQPLVVITAAADVPGYANGQRLDVKSIADALHAKARLLTDSNGAETAFPVATIERAYGQGYDLRGLNESDIMDAIAAGARPEALVASGGWCAPSETLYDLFEVECERDSLFRLPTFRIGRGGVRWPVFIPHDPTFDPGFVWCEADDIAAAVPGGPTKPCITIPCPTFQECRLCAVGLCIKAGNLMDEAYPEQIRWYIARAIRAWERNNSLRQLNQVIADSIPVALPASFAAASALISGLLLQAADYRETNGLCCGQRLDVLLPCWVSDLVKADIARQDGALTIGSLPTDAQVRAWFAAANLDVTFINNWQLIAGDPATAWPGTVQFLIGYPGSWVRFDGGRLDLRVIRDSVLNATNDHTAVFFEEFYCVGRRGPQSRIVTVPVCASGDVGGRVAPAGTILCPAA